MKAIEHDATMIARLSKLPPEVAAEELRAYNLRRSKSEAMYQWGDSKVDSALLARREPLIDLALAQYGANTDVLVELYQRSLAGTGDAVLDLGIRVAALANQLAPSRFFETNPVVNADELKRLAIDGTEEETEALLTNPMTRSYVGDLYRRKPPFDSLNDDRFLALVHTSIRNPRLTFDDSTEDGPDLTLMDISRGIDELLLGVPVTERWLRELNYLLFNFLPESTRGNKNLIQVVDRWRLLKIKDFNSEDLSSGQYTELNETDEFCCRVAAMFGKYFEDGQIKVEGKQDSQDVVLRCAYYGNHDMKPNQMEAAHQKDGDTFTFAALHNPHFYWNRACRRNLESMLRGNQIDLYSTICRKLAATTKRFDPNPVHDDFEIEEEAAQVDPMSEIGKRVGLLEGRMAAVQKDASMAKAFGGWCLLLLLVVLWQLR